MEETIRCPACGATMPFGSRWCQKCGHDLRAPAPAQVPPPGIGSAHHPPATEAAARGQFVEAIRARPKTDQILSVMWILLPVLASLAITVAVCIGMIVLAFSGWVTGAVIVWVVGIVVAIVIAAILFAVLNYKLIDRQNLHSKREAMLRAALIEYIRIKSRERNMSQMLSSHIATMDSIQYEARANEGEHSATLWAILIFIPFVGFIFLAYMLYFLTKFGYEHDKRWHAFTQQAQASSSHLGMTVILPSWRSLPERSFIIYLIVTVLTMGLFLIYWYYVLIKDMNDHFKVQWQFEDQVVAQMH